MNVAASSKAAVTQPEQTGCLRKSEPLTAQQIRMEQIIERITGWVDFCVMEKPLLGLFHRSPVDHRPSFASGLQT
ncbi:hypothetical protein NDU88_004487 [Pleurodeles waltl]|uniref:Uncharacterized protein n=1 Tax=Pleurodeles waltl TaxID=8319 RepID=A0AAV7M7N2_PLEWA|nr:hypothetical protein NDU88_004487 [Pleurodeles waltl]